MISGEGKKGKKKNSGGQHWRSRLYRRLIGPICQFVASTKQATRFPAPDIAVTIEQIFRILERNDLEPISPSRRDASRFENQTFPSNLQFVLLFIHDSSTPCFTFRNFRQNCALFNVIIKYFRILKFFTISYKRFTYLILKNLS